MAKTVEFKLTGDVQRMGKFLDRRFFDKNAQRVVKKTVIRAALYLVKETKRRIRKRDYHPNSEMTLALKRTSIPLLDQKNLFDAITHKMLNSFSAEVGFFKGQSTGGVTGKNIDMQKLVTLMHEGYTIEVTNKMRRALIGALRNQQTKKGRLTGRARKMLKEMEDAADRAPGQAKQFYKVQKRPFMIAVFRSKKVDRELAKIWEGGMGELWKLQGATGGEHKNR